MESQPQNSDLWNHSGSSDFRSHPVNFHQCMSVFQNFTRGIERFSKKQVSMIRKYNNTIKQPVHVLQV